MWGSSAGIQTGQRASGSWEWWVWVWHDRHASLELSRRRTRSQRHQAGLRSDASDEAGMPPCRHAGSLMERMSNSVLTIPACPAQPSQPSSRK